MSESRKRRIGVTGHQVREGADWDWTKFALREALQKIPMPIEGCSCLAVGADQLFSEEVLALGCKIVAVIPGPWYEDCFEGDGLIRYRQLLRQSDIVELAGQKGEQAFLEAGLEVVRRSDEMIAIWDGQPAKGRGGTADIVAFALKERRPVLHLDPVRQTISGLQSRL